MTMQVKTKLSFDSMHITMYDNVSIVRNDQLIVVALSFVIHCGKVLTISHCRWLNSASGCLYQESIQVHRPWSSQATVIPEGETS